MLLRFPDLWARFFVAIFCASVLPVCAAPETSPATPALINSTAQALQDTVPEARRLEQEELRYALQSISRGLARLGKITSALQAVPPHPPYSEADPSLMSDEVFRLSARRFARDRQTAAALAAARRTKNAAARADALFAIARAHLRDRQTLAARTVLYEAAPHARATHRPIAMAYAAWLLASTGDRPGARRLFDAAQKAPSNPDLAPDGDNHHRGISFYQAKAGFFEESIVTVGKDPWAASGVLDFLCRAGRIDLVNRLITQLPVQSRVEKLTESSLYFAKAGRESQARAMLAQLRAIAEGTSDASQNFSNRFYAAMTFAWMGDDTTADELMKPVTQLPRFDDRLKLNYEASYLINPLYPKGIERISRQRREQAIERVLQLASGFKNREKAGFYKTIAEVQRKWGQNAAALESLRHAALFTRYELQAAKDSSNDKLAEIAGLQRDWGDAEGAAQSLQWLLNIGARQWQPTTTAQYLAKAGFFEEAFAVLPVKITASGNTFTYDRIATALAEKRGVAAALNWAREIKSPALRAAALEAITIALFPEPADEKEFVLHATGVSQSLQFAGEAELGPAGTFLP